MASAIVIGAYVVVIALMAYFALFRRRDDLDDVWHRDDALDVMASWYDGDDADDAEPAGGDKT